MRSLKKILSMVLALLMLASVMCTSVSAYKVLAVTELNATVTEPVAGEVPDFLAVSDAKYADIIQVIWWRVEDDNTATAMRTDEVFVEGRTYECDIRFQINDEKALFTEEVAGTVNGEAVDTFVHESCKVCTLCASFVVKSSEDNENHTHDFDDWYETEEASCTHNGEKERVCLICGETETEIIPAYGKHTDDDEDRICDVCGNTLGGFVNPDSSYDEATKDEATKDESSTNEATKDEATKDEQKPSTNDEEKPSDPVVDKGILGDVNGDGKVNIKDATMIQKFAAKIIDLTDAEFIRADVNADGKVNIKDATAIQKFVAKIETGLPIGEKIG